MPKVKAVNSSGSSRMMRPALTPEARENQLIALAMDLAEKQLRDGTAKAQVITEFLKRGSPKEKIERDILKEQQKLIVAKTGAIEATKTNADLYDRALKAMRKYSGQGDSEDDY